MPPAKSIKQDLRDAGYRVERISETGNTNGKRRIVRISDGEPMGNFDAITAWQMFARVEELT
jgi:hypothetical protein